MTNQQTDLVNLNIKYVDAIKNKMVVFFVIPNIRKLHVQCKNVEFVDRSYWIGYLYHGLHWKQKLIDFSCLPLKWIYIHFLSVSRTIQISLLVYPYTVGWWITIKPYLQFLAKLWSLLLYRLLCTKPNYLRQHPITVQKNWGSLHSINPSLQF